MQRVGVADAALDQFNDLPGNEATWVNERHQLLRRQNDANGPKRHFAAVQQTVAFGSIATAAGGGTLIAGDLRCVD